MATEQQPKVKLYWLDDSRSQRIAWLLEELKVPYQVQIFHRNKATYLAPSELEKIHPLGKSPVISITTSNDDGAEPIILAESGFMTQYLCEHFPAEGDRLIPKRWKDGMEGKIGGETDEWLRWQYLMHYCEGSLMPFMVMSLIFKKFKSNAIPFFIRPITGSIANRMFSSFLFPNLHRHLSMLNTMLTTGPGGKYLCGDSLTAADIMMSFPLLAAKERLNDVGAWEGGSWVVEFPKLGEYTARLEAEEGYKRSLEKVEGLEGKKIEASL